MAQAPLVFLEIQEEVKQVSDSSYSFPHLKTPVSASPRSKVEEPLFIVCSPGGSAGGDASDLRRGDSAGIAVIRITLLGFLLHFLFDLLRSPKGSWDGT